MFGTNNRFTPEALGMLMSSAMAWMILEVGAMLLSLYILAVSTGQWLTPTDGIAHRRNAIISDCLSQIVPLTVSS